MQQLSLSARPKNLDTLIGQKKLVKQIRGHMRERVVTWLLWAKRKRQNYNCPHPGIGLSVQSCEVRSAVCGL